MIYSEFREIVKKNLSEGRSHDDDHLVTAIADFVKASYARDFLGDLNSYGSFKGSFDSVRNDLAGYKTSLSLTQVQDQVKQYLSDADADTLFISALSKFVKSRIYLEVEQNEQMGKLTRASYERDRFRLVGHVTSLSDTDLRDSVRKYLPVDKDRQNAIEYADVLIEEGKQDIESMGDWMNSQVEKALKDIEGFDLYVEQQIRQALLDLQNFIPSFRSANTNVFTSSDMTPVGNADEGTMPEGAIPLTATLRYPGLDSICGCQIRFVPWALKDQVVCSSCNCEPVITFDPNSSKFLVYPRMLGDVVELEIVWQGSKIEYADIDPVPFDEMAARAVAYFVQAQIYTYVDKDSNIARAASSGFNEYRRRLAVAEKRKKRLNTDRGPSTCREAEPFIPIILTQPSGQAVEVGGTLELEVQAIGNPGVTFQWFKV